MAEELIISTGDKEQRYRELLPQIQGLLSGEDDLIANMANMVAALQMTFSWLWVGFYIVRGEQLVLGPFQGPIACTRINKGKGVCGSAWQSGAIQLVPDVEQFPGHIACSSLSKSEIVLPVRNTLGEIIAVLDIDSEMLNQFDEIDARYLTQIIKLIN
ncbi:MAG TPA: GAF domain-containing protein [Burkholderiales bacterium]|nr:GAF domain-containing protein [Burkholderiales bacterium]